MDPFSGDLKTDYPVTDCQVVTPSDSTVFSVTSRCVYIGTGGDLAVVMAGGQTVIFKNCSAGQLLPLRVKSIMATNTTASDIVIGW